MGPGKVKCQISLCAEAAFVSLESLGLCLEHFLSASYERLDHLEPMIRRRRLEDSQVGAAYTFLEECSNCALTYALQQEQLTNQNRSRLLNILLLTRHLQLLLRNPVGGIVDFRPYVPGAVSRGGSQQE